jgi:hypothetical protein
MQAEYVQQMIASFLRSRSESLSNTRLTDPGLQDVLSPAYGRIASLESLYRTACSQKTGAVWSDLTGYVVKLYRIGSMVTSVVVAFYGDSDILWLDCLSDDADFETFIRRERLVDWLPYRLEDVVELLIETKFNFLLLPRLVRTAAEIPPLKAGYRSALEKQTPEFVAAMDRRFEGLVGQIQPPRCIQHPDGVFRLGFYVWTIVLGKVIKVDCLLGPGCSFGYEVAQLTDQVGMFTKAI